ncbi:MAG: glucosamine-6-phosphate deaminase [Chitinophagaceae bacterium]
MQLKIYKNYQSLSAHISDEMIALIKHKPNAVICCASGDTPRLTCQLFAEKATTQKIDTSKFTFIGLDEWVGIPSDNEGSCRYFFDSLVIKPLQLATSQFHFFNALSNDVVAECKTMDKFITDKGGIDLMIVGIGMNGHIGFNEPGVSFDNYSHFIQLDATTITVGQKYFKDNVSLDKGITIGLQHLVESKEVILIANGLKKAAVIKTAVEGGLSNSFPATIIQKHPTGVVAIDEEAASLLSR